MEPLLRACNLWKARGSRWVVNEVSFSLERSSIVHLQGANGAGKTTLLRMIAGEMPPSKGHVEIDGVNLGLLPNEGRQRMSLVPENLLPSAWLSVSEYLQFRADIRSLDSAHIDELIEEWEFTEFAQRPMATLSNGERRRVIIAAAMMAKPDILILDEPTVGMDARQRELLAQRLERYKEDRLVLVASHIERQGLPEFTQTLTIVEGRLEGAEDK